MTTDNRARLRIEPPAVGGGASREQLENLWWALVKALTDAMADANNPPKASMINVARAFLVDNHVSRDTLSTSGEDALARLAKAMGSLGLPEEGGDDNEEDGPDTGSTTDTIH